MRSPQTEKSLHRILDVWFRLKAAEYKAFRQGLLPRSGRPLRPVPPPREIEQNLYSC